MIIVENKEYFSPREARESGFCCVGDQTLRNYVRRGRLACVKIGTRYFFTKNDLKALTQVVTPQPHVPTNGSATIR